MEEDDDRGWDAGHVRHSLTSAEGLVDAFNLPRTPDTLAAASRAVASLKAEADARIAPCLPASMSTIESRLTSLVKAGKGADAKQAPNRVAAAAFASETLAALNAVPLRARQVTHALLVRSSRLPLADALALEHRVLGRVLTGEGASTASSNSKNNNNNNSTNSNSVSASRGWGLDDPSAPLLTPAQLEALFAPLPAAPSEAVADVSTLTSGLFDLPPFHTRPVQKEVAAAAEAQTEQWMTALTAAYEDGTADGELQPAFVVLCITLVVCCLTPNQSHPPYLSSLSFPLVHPSSSPYCRRAG